jgi:hypothetical protein
LNRAKWKIWHGTFVGISRKWSVRGDASNKHVIGIDVRWPAFQIAEQSVADIFWMRQRHLERVAVPVDVIETQTVTSPERNPNRAKSEPKVLVSPF